MYIYIYIYIHAFMHTSGLFQAHYYRLMMGPSLLQPPLSQPTCMYVYMYVCMCVCVCFYVCVHRSKDGPKCVTVSLF